MADLPPEQGRAARQSTDRGAGRLVLGARRGTELLPVVGDFVRLARIARFEGWAGLRARAARKVRPGVLRVQARWRLAALLEEVRRSTTLPVVMASTVDWNIVLFQRPQQLAQAFAAIGCTTLYVTPNEIDDVSGCRQVAERCYLVDRLAPCLKRLDRAILVVPSPTPRGLRMSVLQRARGRFFVVYDYLDALHPDVAEVSASVRRRHEEMIRTADLVSATSRALWNEATRLRPGACLLCPNAADVSHFRLAAPPPVPEELRPLVGSHRPILGYSGALARWIDYALLRRIGEHRPEWWIVLVGWDYDGSLAASGILDLPGVRFLGPRPYEVLPAYVAHFDVAILPFLVNEMTVAVSPIKLFEYMAARKPVVCTNLPECREYASPLVCTTHDEFLSAIEEALGRRGDERYLALLDQEADSNTWDARARALLEFGAFHPQAR